MTDYTYKTTISHQTGPGYPIESIIFETRSGSQETRVWLSAEKDTMPPTRSGDAAQETAGPVWLQADTGPGKSVEEGLRVAPIVLALRTAHEEWQTSFAAYLADRNDGVTSDPYLLSLPRFDYSLGLLKDYRYQTTVTESPTDGSDEENTGARLTCEARANSTSQWSPGSQAGVLGQKATKEAAWQHFRTWKVKAENHMLETLPKA